MAKNDDAGTGGVTADEQTAADERKAALDAQEEALRAKAAELAELEAKLSEQKAALEEERRADEEAAEKNATNRWRVKSDCFTQGVLYHEGDIIKGGDFSKNPNIEKLN